MFASKDTLLTRPSGYTIARSVRLRSSATAYFNRTLSSSNRQTWTYSVWAKLGAYNSSTGNNIFCAGDGQVGTDFESRIDATTPYFKIVDQVTGTANLLLLTTQVFRDPSAWYHIVVSIDTTQATASNRAKLYINGAQVTSFSTATYPTQNYNTNVNTAVIHWIGALNLSGSAARTFDGYLAEFNFIDGQALTPSSFGETDSITGVWKPKAYSGTYGTNGFELNFSDNSNNTATTIGKDYSGNGNNWTPNNISVTAGVTYDSMTDVPTLTSATAANYGVMNPVAMTSNVSATNGNLTTSFTGLANAAIYGTFLLPTSGKWYFESTISTVNTATSQDAGFGIVDATTTLSNISAQTFSNGVIYRNRGDSDSRLVVNGSSVVSGQIAYDADSGKVWVGRNNSWFDTSGGTTGNPSSGTNQIGTLTTTINMLPVARAYSNTLVMNWNFGQRPFSYTPPSGFVALNTYNLPTSTITNGSAYMAATTYTGNGSTQTVSNAVGSTSFQPDFVWIKDRNTARGSMLFDSVRGIYIRLRSNTTDAEQTETDTLTAFNSNGFNLSTNVAVNGSTETYVGWQWKAGTTSASNTNGSITSTVSAGATQGFSVVTYTATNAAGTIGHGLGVAPSLIITKNRSDAGGRNWGVYHTSIGATKFLQLNSTNASTTGAAWNNTAPTSSVFSVGGGSFGETNFPSGDSYVAYCFSAVAGYSAFGSYTGNGSADGPFVYLGFRPRFMLVKRTDAVTDWQIIDSARNTYNAAGTFLYPNLSNAEDVTDRIDFVSNGFKLRTASGPNNASSTWIYACFAENPFKYALAR